MCYSEDKMKCSICDKRLKPIAIIAGERFYYACDTCLEEICPNCCDIEEETGTVECVNCIETRVRRRQASLAPKEVRDEKNTEFYGLENLLT